MNVVTRAATFAALLLAPIVASSQEAPKAEEIISRYVSAIGGKDAIMKVSSIKMIGTVQMPALGITGNVESFAAAPNRSSSHTTIPGLGDIAEGYDGTVAWQMNPMVGPRIKNEKETVSAAENSDFYGAMLYSKERFQSLETVGAADFGGEKTWQVKTVLKSGRVVDEFFSVATGLKVGSHAKQESAQGVIDVVTIESDYKQFGAIKLATKNDVTTGPQKMLVSINSVELGEVPVTAFTLPEPVRALVKPQ